MASAQLTFVPDGVILLYTTGPFQITQCSVVVNNTQLPCTVTSVTRSTSYGSNYVDTILTVQLSFSSGGGTLSQISISANTYCSGSTCAAIIIQSSENIQVPSGTVTIAKTYVARWSYYATQA